MNNKEEFTDNSSENLSYKEKRRIKAKEKRQKDQMSVTIFGLILYSVILIAVVVLSYIGFKSGINNYREQKAQVIEEEKRQKEAEKKALEEQEKAEREAKEAAELEEAKQKQEEESGYKDTVFSVIENVSDPGSALVNGFIFSRKSLNDDNGKVMDYELYTDPETNSICKVTTRENCGDLYEITDYYYDNGRVNYIAQYREDTDIPIDLSGDKIESRFYFSKDKMVRYVYCEGEKAIEYKSEDFDSYSEGTIGQYTYMEDMMLESSRSAYKNAKSLDEKVKISGYILDELGCASSDPVNLELLDLNGRVIESTVANEDGYYSIEVSSDKDAEYILDIRGRDDMEPTRMYGIKIPKGSKNYDADTVYLSYNSYDTIYPVQIFVKDADDVNKALSGADIKIRYGLNNRDGETILSGVLGDAGEIMPALRSGNYTAEISKNGYETCYVSFPIKADHTALVAYATKDVKEGSFKCILTYETTPLDIDLRAYDTYGRNIYKSPADSVGITMAECISLDNNDSGTYTFYASNYTDIVACDMMSYRLSQSQAKMYVYGENGLECVFSVPAGHAGVVWRPFEIRNRKVIPINDFYSFIVEDSAFRNK